VKTRETNPDQAIEERATAARGGGSAQAVVCGGLAVLILAVGVSVVLPWLPDRAVAVILAACVLTLAVIFRRPLGWLLRLIAR